MPDSFSMLCQIPLCMIPLCLIPVYCYARFQIQISTLCLIPLCHFLLYHFPLFCYDWFRYDRFRYAQFSFLKLYLIPLCHITLCPSPLWQVPRGPPHIPISNRLGNGEDRYISISPPNLTAEKLHLPLASPPTDGLTDGFGVNDAGEDALKPVLFFALSLEGGWDPHQTDLPVSDPF